MEGSCNITTLTRPAAAAPARKGRFILSVAMPVVQGKGGPFLGGSSRQVVSFRVVDNSNNQVGCVSYENGV